MIDLEKERELFQDFLTENYDFENHEQTYFDEKTQCYVNDCGEDTEHLNIAWETHKKCAESKQAKIDSLKAQLEQLDKVWISVDFMLPNEGEKVLIMIGDEQTVAEKCNVFGFIDVLDREALRTDLITYWMPLPEPPKKASQENSHE